MKIDRIETFPVRLPLKPERRMISALGRHDVSDFLLVRIFANNGLEGVGEATVTPRWSGETVGGAKFLIDRVLAPALIGLDPVDLSEIDRRMEALAVGNWFAKASIEMACWDLIGKGENRPVFELLGGACRPLTIRNRFSMGAYEPSIAAERARERVAAGFDTIKVKVGVGPDDVARVQAVREAIGPDVALTIDANGGWDEPTALEALKQLEECRLSIVEQPLPRGNYAGLRRLREKMGCKILADESCFDLVQAEELIEQGCCDALSIYPGKNGGIGRAREIAVYAASRGIPCTIGSNLEWDVATAAMLHLIVATPNLRVDLYPGDCLGPFYHEASIARNPTRIEGPFTTLEPGPGLGIEVDREAFERYRVDV